MIDITHKSNTLREATAEAVVCVSKLTTIEAILNKKVPKGDVFEMAKTAGLFGVKKTSSLIPDCHPLPIEFTSIDYEINQLNIHIKVHVKTIYKTGVEVEAMHGASIVALTIYDMLKPIDKEIEIKNIKLIDKKGGKSDGFNAYETPVSTAIVICSSLLKKELKINELGTILTKKINQMGLEIVYESILNDNKTEISDEFTLLTNQNIDLILFVGGTGLSKSDITTDTILPLLDKEIPGASETMRNYGQNRTPLALFSRSFAGVKNQSIVLGIPGSKKGAIESIDAVLPQLLHGLKILKGKK